MHAEQDDPLNALGDPSRRAIFRLLCERDRAVGELVARVALSQPAVSQHLRVLRDASLVTVRVDGRRRVYRASPAGLRRLRDEVERFWQAALVRMKSDLEASAGASTRQAASRTRARRGKGTGDGA
jgi:DNA-binding transcriptional ArsR family regulator